MPAYIHNAQAMITVLQEKHDPQRVNVMHAPLHPVFCLVARGLCNEQDSLQLLPLVPAWSCQGLHVARCLW